MRKAKLHVTYSVFPENQNYAKKLFATINSKQKQSNSDLKDMFEKVHLFDHNPKLKARNSKNAIVNDELFD